MLTVNMNRPYNHRNHPQIAKGVNINKFRTRQLSLQELMMEGIAEGDGPQHLRDPFRYKNHLNRALEFKEPLGQYNDMGNFSATEKSVESRRRAMHRMQMNSHIIMNTNSKRPLI